MPVHAGEVLFQLVLAVVVAIDAVGTLEARPFAALVPQVSREVLLPVEDATAIVTRANELGPDDPYFRAINTCKQTSRPGDQSVPI